MTAYEELLEFGGERIFDFLKNARLHESQFKYSEFNEVCYKKMYIENNQDSIKTVKELKEEIPELKDTCKGCGSYFMNPRNKSIKGLDVQFALFVMYLSMNQCCRIFVSITNTSCWRGCIKRSCSTKVIRYNVWISTAPQRMYRPFFIQGSNNSAGNCRTNQWSKIILIQIFEGYSIKPTFIKFFITCNSS